MKTYTLCGSMKFEKEMRETAWFLETQKGFNILQCTYSDVNSDLTEEGLARIAAAHYRKIDISDGIYVLNIDGYVGESVSAEIEYAKKHGKEIHYHC